jgi:hypothetical protein
MSATVTLQRKRERDKRMAREVILRDDDWLNNYANHFRASGN